MRTKPYVMIITVFLLMQISVSAQNFKFGIVGGLDFTNNHTTNVSIREDNPRSYAPMTSFNLNAYVGFNSKSFWGMSVEPGFIIKGGIDKNETGVINDDKKIQLSYMQMPVLFDLYFTDYIYVSCGPEFAYLISAQSISMGKSNSIWDLYSRPFEVSGLIGLNLSLTKNLDIGIRYNHGLTWISKVIYYNTDNIRTTSNEFNQYLQLVVRLKI